MGTEVSGGSNLVPELTEIWARILGHPQLGPDEDFFELGGHSLSAVRMLTDIAARLGIQVPVHVLFAAPTVRALARVLAEPGLVAAPRPAAGDGDVGPLSWTQEWSLRSEQSAPGNTFLNTFVRFEIQGRYDAYAGTAALLAVVRRHEVLRTRYRLAQGGAVQVVARLAELEITEHDLSGLAAADRAAALDRLVRADAAIGFELGAAAPLRAMVVLLAVDRTLVLVALHHIAFDGWSRDIFLDDFAAAYRDLRAGGRGELAPPELRYRDFARWQRERFAGGRAAPHAAYWRVIAGYAPPRAPAEPAGDLRYRSMDEPVVIPGAVLADFRELTRTAGLTLFMGCLAAFGLALARHLGTDRLPLATLAANRAWGATQDLVGSFATVLPIGLDLRGEPTFRELLRRCRQASLEAMRHQEYPLEHAMLTGDTAEVRRFVDSLRFGIALHQPIRGPRDLGDAELVQVRTGFRRPGEAEINPSTFELALELREQDGELTGWLQHQVGAVPPAVAARLAGDFTAVVRAACAEPAAHLDRLWAGVRRG